MVTETKTRGIRFEMLWYPKLAKTRGMRFGMLETKINEMISFPGIFPLCIYVR